MAYQKVPAIGSSQSWAGDFATCDVGALPWVSRVFALKEYPGLHWVIAVGLDPVPSSSSFASYCRGMQRIWATKYGNLAWEVGGDDRNNGWSLLYFCRRLDRSFLLLTVFYICLLLECSGLDCCLGSRFTTVTIGTLSGSCLPPAWIDRTLLFELGSSKLPSQINPLRSRNRTKREDRQ